MATRDIAVTSSRYGERHPRMVLHSDDATPKWPLLHIQPTAQPTLTPVAGDVYVDATTGELNVHNGTAWVAPGDAVFDPRHYGVLTAGGSPTADQTTTNTNVIQAAIDAAEAAGGGTVLIPGDYKVTGLTVQGPGITLSGTSRVTSRLRTSAGDLIALNSSAAKFACRHLSLYSASGGGHLFTQSGNFSHGLFFDLTLVQDNTAKAYWYQTTGDFIDTLWMQIDAQHSNSATMAGWYLHTGSVNRNRWCSIRPTYAGAYVWDIESTSASSYANDNTIEAVTAEATNGGVVKLRGAMGTRLADIGVYDLGTTTNHLFDLGTASAGLLTFGTTFENVRRHGGTLGGGLYDVTIAGTNTASRHMFINCGSATSLQVDANNHLIHVIGWGSVTVADDTYATYQAPGTVQGVVRSVAASPSLLATESGGTFIDIKGSGQTVFSLPATRRGVTFTFVCGDAAGEIAISPDAADQIMGKGITAADDKDYVNTGATNAVGDLVTIVGDGVDGWWVVNERGTWARET